MAFIDWLKKQHADSLIASQRMAADPFLKGIKPGAMNFPAAPERMGRPGSASRGQSLGGLTAQGVLPFQRTKPGFFARDYKKEDLVKKVMIEKNDGTKEIKSEWEEPRFPVHQGSVMATALPAQQPTSVTPMAPGRVNPAGSLDLRLNPLHWGRQNPNVPGSMGRDPGWAGVPRARQQRSLVNMGMMDLRPRLGMPGQAESLARISAPDSIGMPQVADLRNRLAEIGRQQAAIPRQQMPPPRFVPPVDPSQFPTVQDRNTGTYNLGEPGVVMSEGGPSLENLRQNVGEDLRGAWNPIRERMQKIIEDIRRKREGQTMAPFDRGWY